MQDIIIIAAVSEVDEQLLIHTDHYQQEREGHVAGRPNFKPEAIRGTKNSRPIPLSARRMMDCSCPSTASIHQGTPRNRHS